MASTKEIKRRIKSTKSTKKITKAMELVAASKMKKAISQTLASRLYSTYSWDILTSLSERLENITHKFFTENTNTNKHLIVLISSNRGLCGGYNSQIIKKAIAMIKEESKSAEPISIDIVTVGKKGDGAMRRTGQNIVASFLEMPENVSLQDVIPISNYFADEFKKENYNRIYIAYTDFVSALSQKPVIRKLLPISKVELKEVVELNIKEKAPDSRASMDGARHDFAKSETPYLLEGETEKLLDTLAEKLVRMQIYQMFLESSASEQSSRMVAMKNANEAAEEMINDLTLVFNKARQSNITKEISEISAGMASVS
jgi:F-type H+-transporting ATPase subunit gamma